MTLPHQALRQSAASLFAYALLDLFPRAQLRECEIDQIGFNYAFYLEQPLEDGILVLFEEKMRAIAKRGLEIEATDMMRENAMQLFRHHGQKYKAELVGASPYNIVPILKIGQSFYDYGAPPYAANTADLVAFKLQKLERVKGEEHVFLVTGTIFPDAKQLKRFLKNFEAAKRKDHRLLGPELGLYALLEEVGAEGWFWFPKGAFLRETLIGWWRREHQAAHFLPVHTPRLSKSSILQKAGIAKQDGSELVKVGEDAFLVPGLEFMHALLYRSQPHTSRELPIRYAEFAELQASPTGRSCGLLNSSFCTVERAQIFCAESQVLVEIISSLQFIEKTVNMLGFECQWSLLLRGSKFAGTIKKWDNVLELMKEALQVSKSSYSIDASGSSFDGPRMVVRMKDALGREWDGPFIEVNLNYPECFGLLYKGADGKVHAPYMITRSMFGSLERYIAVLVEHYEGDFPLWLAPEQVRLLPIASTHHPYADEVCKVLTNAGVRCHVDYRQEPLGTKVHAAECEKIPYAVILGDAEQKDGVVNIRTCSRQGQTKRIKLAVFLQMIQEEAALPAALLEGTKKSYSEE